VRHVDAEAGERVQRKVVADHADDRDVAAALRHGGLDRLEADVADDDESCPWHERVVGSARRRPSVPVYRGGADNAASVSTLKAL
jgi:hypothetical protein